MDCSATVEWTETKCSVAIRADGAAIALGRLKRALESAGADEQTLDIVRQHLRAAEALR